MMTHTRTNGFMHNRLVVWVMLLWAGLLLAYGQGGAWALGDAEEQALLATWSKDQRPVVPDQIMVRFTPEVAARLHVMRLQDSKNTRSRWSSKLGEAGVKSLGKSFVGLKPFVSGEEHVRKTMKRQKELSSVLKATGRFSTEQAEMACQAIMDDSTDIGPTGLFYVKLAKGSDPRKASLEMMKRSDVVFAHPSPLCKLDGTADDPLFPRQWNLGSDQIRVTDAWDASTTWTATFDPDNAPLVAVIDTGVRITHEDLNGRTLFAKDIFVDDNYLDAGGEDAYADEDEDNDDPDGHGTACAGIIGAIRNNALGIAGIAPVYIVPINGAIKYEGDWLIANYPDGIMYAIDKGASIVSMSFGGYGTPLQAEIQAAQYAEINSVLGFAAAGNDETSANDHYPAAFKQFVCIAATDQFKYNVTTINDLWWWGSNFGDVVELCAPGQGDVGSYGDSILTLGNTSNQATINNFNGTSASTPHAAGVAGLLKLMNPSLDAVALRAYMKMGAQDMVGHPNFDPEGWDKYHGYGLIDAHLSAVHVTSGTEILGPYEPNDTKLVAADLSDYTGHWLSDVAKLPQAEDIDWYTFRVPSDYMFINVFMKDNGAALTVKLYGPTSSNTLATSTSLGDMQHLRRQLSLAGYYYIKVSSVAGYSNGMYDLCITLTEPGRAEVDLTQWELYE